MTRCYLWVSLALVACTDSTKATSATSAYDDLYGDAEEHHEAQAYPPPAYHSPEPAYHAPEPAYHAPEPASYEPPYQKEEYHEEPSGEYDNVPYEAESIEYVPAAKPEVLYVEPCKNNADCGQGICDIHYKCRCMDFWWTPNPKKGLKPRDYNPNLHRAHEDDRRLRQGGEEDRSLLEDDTSLPTGPLVRPCSQKRKSQAEAFLLQLFLGWIGFGCWYLGSGWYGMAVATMILGCFPVVVCLIDCLCGTFCLCCVKPLISCITRCCTCCFKPYDPKDPDMDEAEYDRVMCMNFCYCLASIAFLVLWIISLVMITNDCVTGPGIPCVPW